MYAPIFLFPLTCVYRLVAKPLFTTHTRPLVGLEGARDFEKYIKTGQI